MSSGFWWKLEILAGKFAQWVHEKRVEATNRYLTDD